VLGLCSCSGSSGSITACTVAASDADAQPEALGLLQAGARARRSAVSTDATAIAGASIAVAATANSADASGGDADDLTPAPMMVGLRVQERRAGLIDYSGFWQCSMLFDDGIRDFRQNGSSLQVLTACDTWRGTVHSNDTFELASNKFVPFSIICQPEGDRIVCENGDSCKRVRELSSFDAATSEQLQGTWINMLDMKPGTNGQLQFNFSNYDRAAPNDEWMRWDYKMSGNWTHYTGRPIQKGSMFQTCLCDGETGSYSGTRAQMKFIQGQLQLIFEVLNGSEQTYDTVATMSFYEVGAEKGHGWTSSPIFWIVATMLITPILCFPACGLFRSFR